MVLIKRFAFVLLAIALIGCGSQPTATAHSAPDLLFNYHFVGTTNLFKGTNLATLKGIWELPESAQLRDSVLQKFAKTPEQLFGRGGTNNPESSALLRPLLEDLLVVESMAEVRRGTNAPGEVVIAVRLPSDRVRLWDTNLQKVVSGFVQQEPQTTNWEKFSGWEVKQKGSPSLFRSIWTGEWLVLGIGSNELPLQNNILRRLATGNAPVEWKGSTNWLETTIDFPRLQEWIPLKHLSLKPARTEIALSTKGGNVRTGAKAVYPESLNWTAQKWQIPTNIIRDPLLSFTAAQNLSALIKSPKILVETGSNPLTNQYFIWSQTEMPFMTFGAMPVQDSIKTLDHLGGRLPHLFNPQLEEANGGKLVLRPDKSLVWSGLSMITPELLATNEAAGQFIMIRLFPLAASKHPIPKELVEQISTRTNLIYYDWEITQHRLGQWQMLSRMLPFMQPKRVSVSPELMAQAKTNPAVRKELSHRFVHEKWLGKIAPSLGNSITEVSLVAPDQIELVRVSHIGFTGIELLYLGNWLNDPRFPLFKDPSSQLK